MPGKTHLLTIVETLKKGSKTKKRGWGPKSKKLGLQTGKSNAVESGKETQHNAREFISRYQQKRSSKNQHT